YRPYLQPSPGSLLMAAPVEQSMNALINPNLVGNGNVYVPPALVTVLSSRQGQPANAPRNALGQYASLPPYAYVAPIWNGYLSFIQEIAEKVLPKNNLTSGTISQGVGPVAAGSGSLAVYSGGAVRRFWLYRGRDRDLLLQTLRDMLELVKRDELVESGKLSLKLSNHHIVFPDEVPGLAGSIIVLIRALKYDVSLVRVPGIVDEYIPLSDKDLYAYLYSMWPNLAPFGADDEE
ncbi:MAG TPA: hypothetical protein VMS08_01535, partial [Candidatus Saccharimonadia bacterium]|nr:hypothetical protein [Candidatus Saccharimonadia bacterium]